MQAQTIGLIDIADGSLAANFIARAERLQTGGLKTET